MSFQPRLPFFMCHFCSHVMHLKDPEARTVICERCGHKNHRFNKKSAEKTLIYSLTALIFYFPANLYPFMTLETYGNRNTTTIWSGIVAIADSGDLFIAIVIFLASLLTPLIKLLILLYLALTAKYQSHSSFKTRLYHFVEAIGRWSMLDIFLMAVLVAVMKTQKMASVEPGLGAVMFLVVVIFTMMASAQFDPQLLWKDNRHERIH